MVEGVLTAPDLLGLLRNHLLRRVVLAARGLGVEAWLPPGAVAGAVGALGAATGATKGTGAATGLVAVGAAGLMSVIRLLAGRGGAACLIFSSSSSYSISHKSCPFI